MTNRIVAAGVACGGLPDHRVCSWTLTGDRVLTVEFERGGVDRIPTPIPGSAPVLAVAPHHRTALLGDRPGSRPWLDRSEAAPVWRRGYQLREDSMDNTEFVGGGCAGCGTFYAVDGSRRIFAWRADNLNNVGLLSPGSIPGTAAVVAVQMGQPTTALLASGERFALVGTGWAALSRLADAPAGAAGTPGKVRVRVIGPCGFSLGGNDNASPGDVVEIDQGWATELLRSNRVELATEPA